MLIAVSRLQEYIRSVVVIYTDSVTLRHLRRNASRIISIIHILTSHGATNICVCDRLTVTVV